MFDVARVASGTSGITAPSGSYYGSVPTEAYGGPTTHFTRLDGYSSTFPVGGFTTSVDIYLDTSLATGSNDLRFDWSSAVNDTSGNHRRDFVFSVGTSSRAGQIVMSASNNSPGYPADSGRDPFSVSTSGWYTFRNAFSDDGLGVLQDQMSVLDSGGNTLHTWTLSDPTDMIGTTVGGNRYGWFVYNLFPSLAVDNVRRWSGTQTTLGACSVTQSGTSPTRYDLMDDCTTDQTIHVPQNAGGSAFYGNGHTITGVDPSGGHFEGAVLQADAGPDSISIDNVSVSASNLVDACDGATPVDTRLRGILFDGVSGSVTNSTVTDIEQGTNGESGCQEGSGIEVRNSAGTGTPSVTVSNNTVTDYQKTGILATGSVATIITDNKVTGDGHISYIAQNGVQVSFKATAKLVGNDVSQNYYDPPKVTACGLLIYKAGGVSGATKTGLKYVNADNDFHANEQNICNFGKGGGYSPTS